MRADAIGGWLAPLFLVLCVLIGGASNPGSGGDVAHAILQWLSVLLILFSVWTRREPYPEGARSLLLIGAAWLLAVLLYLVPLPWSWWTSLPGREVATRGYELLGMQPSLPVSLSPNDSIASILNLLPATAMLLLTLQLSVSQRRRLVATFIGLATFSTVLGIAQMAGGRGSQLRFYAITNPDMAVGVFANGNHNATLLLCALAYVGYLMTRSVTKTRSREARVAMFISAVVAIFMIMGIGLVGAIAGYGLLIPVILGALLIYRRASVGRIGWKWASAAVAFFGIAVLLAFVGPFSTDELAAQFGSDPISRSSMAATTVQAIGTTLPWGTGLGTFPDVYRWFEDPFRPSTVFVNHAHNDYLEVALDMGVPGILLIAAFLAWFARAALRAWRNDRDGGNMARAASLAILVILLHSLVEYPLRTPALSAVFAMSCALMLPAVVRRRRTRADEHAGGGVRHMEAD